MGFAAPRVVETPYFWRGLPRNWMKVLPLAPCQSVHVQPRQGSGTTGSSCLQGF
jgi:hypothetical protein